jgi:hypothetical protein
MTYGVYLAIIALWSALVIFGIVRGIIRSKHGEMSRKLYVVTKCGTWEHCNELDQVVLVADDPFKVQEKTLEIERDKTYKANVTEINGQFASDRA